MQAVVPAAVRIAEVHYAPSCALQLMGGASSQPLAHLMAALVVALKLLYGLDGQARRLPEGLPAAPHWLRWAQQAIRRAPRPSIASLAPNEASRHPAGLLSAPLRSPPVAHFERDAPRAAPYSPSPERRARRRSGLLDRCSAVWAQVTGLSGPEMRAYVDNLRSRFWGEQRDGGLMPTDMQETCATLELDIRDMQLRHGAAPAPESGGAAAGEPPRERRSQAAGVRGPMPAYIPTAAARSEGPGSGRSDCAPGAWPGEMLEIDRSGGTGGDFYVLWTGNKPEMHPTCAAVLLACASYAWLLPEYLQSLVAELEAAMLETEDLMRT